MRQFGGGFDLALEPLDRGFVLGERCRQELDRHLPLHVPMLGFEDLPHAAGADLAEQHIIAEQQRRLAAREDLAGLKLGELLGFDQRGGKRLAIFGTLPSRQRTPEGFDLADRRKPCSNYGLRKLVGGHCHGQGTSVDGELIALV